MTLEAVIDKLMNHAAVAACADDLATEDTRFAVAARLRPALVAAVGRRLERPMLVVTGGVGEAEEFEHEIRNYLAADRVLSFRAHEAFPWEEVRPDSEGAGARLAALSALEAQEPVIIVAPVSAIMRRLAPRSSQVTSHLRVVTNGLLGLDDAVLELVEMGYERAHVVEARGQFAVRGGIVDVFPSTSEYPVRIELFGDSVESIRRFLVSSQQSVSREEEIAIYGCRDVRPGPQAVARATKRLEKKARVDARAREDLERMAAGHDFPGLEAYMPQFYDKLETIADYLPADAVVVLDEPKKIRDSAARHLERVAAARGRFDASEFFVSSDELIGLLGRCRRLDLFILGEATPLAAHTMESRPIEPALGRTDRIIARVTSLRAMDAAIVICLRDEGHARRVRELLADARLPVLPAGSELQKGVATIEVADVINGFIVPDLALAVVAHTDLFPRAGRPRTDHQTSAAEAARMLAGLRAGDYVVHDAHGVAVYRGIESREVYGLVRDYLMLQYAGADRLFVPVDQIGRVSRYVGPDGKPPKITRLSSNDWARATRKARASVKKLAFDLSKLYAERSRVPGHAFAPDTVWQAELEDGFPFEETLDQLGAIAAVKADMERPVPMDRLVCGDVGYGKTEVAIRAAAKAVLDDRQVIVLAPTTILAQQHHATFCERFATFPVRIEMLSRFRSRGQQERTLVDFALGKVDVLIGTHRLLQKDVVPKDLGLVVVDEEQRFGVGHKEHLRNMRRTVDVLTLSATPIPRTLQMSIVGVRDLSVIDTPPEDRFEVATEVGQYDPQKVREAIARELDRDGQVFYVYNRVQTIGGVAERVRGLAKDARIAVAHGQMREHELEKVMRSFLAREIDVLVCTTIIESGIDVPTANTLVVEGAEHMGLGQLYQLRGRVGRSHHRAFAYFFFSSQKVLTHAALERLSTIREFTELGSGMKIAMRDLEIRGAGNMLGPEQHGHMAAVGFELYCQMLRDAIADARGEPPEAAPEAKISLPVDAYLPESYIDQEDLRIEAYRQIADAADDADVQRVRRELADRFGPLPSPAANLLQVAEARIVAAQAGLTDIGVTDSMIRIDFEPHVRSAAIELASRRGGRVLSEANRLLVPSRSEVALLPMVLGILGDIMTAVGLQQD